MSNIDVNLIKQEVLSLLVSAKDGLDEKELLNDYRLFNSNQDIPYKQLGYSSLISLLRSWPDVCRFQQYGNNGLIKILAVEEDSTKHILSMVKRQRRGKNRRRGQAGRNRTENRNVRFSQPSNKNNNNRTTTNGRFNSNRFERSTTGQSNIPISNQSNQQKNKIKQQNKNFSQFSDNRRVMNNSKSLKIIISNQISDDNNVEFYEDEQEIPKTASPFSDGESNHDDEKEDEVINNLRNLLTTYPHGIRLLHLNELYQEKFNKSLLKELKISNILLLQDYVEDFATISRHGEENGSCDHIITLKNPKQIEQTKTELLQQITDSGIVSKTFRYGDNLLSYINDETFQGYASNIDQNEPCFYIQPIRYQEHIETLMGELDSYYSSLISDRLIIDRIETGLSCVTKFNDSYHRAFIKETDLYKCVIVYVDFGITEEINKDDRQFKYLLKHFAQLPSMIIPCRLYDVTFIPDDNQWLKETYNEVHELCQTGSFYIQRMGENNQYLSIKILDSDGTSLNDIVVQRKLAVKTSTIRNNFQQQNISKPVALKFDFLDTVSQDPKAKNQSNIKSKENSSLQKTIPSSNFQHQFKLIEINENNSLYLIRYQMKRAFIPCFNLANLLKLSESDILPETLLSRVRLEQTNECQSIFDFLKRTDSTNCSHIKQNFLFLFDLISTLKFIEQFQQKDHEILIEILREQISRSSEPDFWNNAYECYKQSKSIPTASSVQSSNKNDFQRYNELLTRRRSILCNMFNINDVSECALELTSIETELQQLIKKMRSCSTNEQNTNSSVTTTNINNQQRLPTNNSDKLKDLMERCKKLINTILILDDYVDINDNNTDYIHETMQLLNSKKNSLTEEELYEKYNDFHRKLKLIVDDLKKQLPDGVPL